MPGFKTKEQFINQGLFSKPSEEEQKFEFIQWWLWQMW